MSINAVAFIPNISINTVVFIANIDQIQHFFPKLFMLIFIAFCSFFWLLRGYLIIMFRLQYTKFQ